MLDLTFALRAYAGFRLRALAREEPVQSQRQQLTSLLRRAANTQFGREYGFAGIHSVEEYQRAVPLRRYDAFWDGYWSRAYPVLDNVTWPGIIPFFANSSGTSSGVTKHIPVSAAMAKANRRAAIDLLVHHSANKPNSRVLGGKNFFLGGSAALTPVGPDVMEGDLSGIAAARVPWWAKGFYFPTGDDAKIADWEEKSRVLARRALSEDIRSLSGTPSWLLLFFEEMKQAAPGSSGRLVEHWPELEMLVHGGISFEPYRARFAELLAGSHAETREVYPASEGFIALQDKGPRQGLRLLTDNGLFFEFVPMEELDSTEPTRHWLGTVETGVNYALVLTSCAGLWSYIIGDTVRFLEKFPPRLIVTGRTSYGLSAFGEHLIGEEIDAAIAAAALATDIAVTDFMVGPVFAPSGPGHHLYLIEGVAVAPEKAELFAQTIDAALCARNVDYAEHRKGGFGMGQPQVRFVRSGGFVAWMKARGKLGGQNKVPRVIADADAFAATAVSLFTPP
ncbi:MAG: GH3 auxin-responsive promoter family protein [Rhizomicrobium sp.]|nr:GH3 auxin-responsive promoter family protein [Rhizomicrobium sp.]